MDAPCRFSPVPIQVSRRGLWTASRSGSSIADPGVAGRPQGGQRYPRSIACTVPRAISYMSPFDFPRALADRHRSAEINGHSPPPVSHLEYHVAKTPDDQTAGAQERDGVAWLVSSSLPDKPVQSVRSHYDHRLLDRGRRYRYRGPPQPCWRRYRHARCGVFPVALGVISPTGLPGLPSQRCWHALSILQTNRDTRLWMGILPVTAESIMKRWIHLLSGVAIAATIIYHAAPEVVGPGQRPAPEGWRSHDDPEELRRSPRHAGRPTERAGARVASRRDLLLERGVVALNDNPLDRLRRSGLI